MKVQILFLLVLGFLFFGCISTHQAPVDNESGQLKIVASFYPLYDITKNVAGDVAQVDVLIPPGSEPHSYEPSPKDIIGINNADVYVKIGVEFEEFEEEILESLDSKIEVIDASKNIELVDAESSHSHDHEEEHMEHEDHENEEHHEEHEDEHDEHESEHEEEHFGADPHYWVSPKNAIIIAKNIKEELVRIDPENKESYEQNTKDYIEKLQNLDVDYSNELSMCEKDVIITTHAAFAYLGNDYGFGQVPILGLSPESEPTPSQIANLIDEAREHDLKYIFYEELVDPRISETISNEVGAQTLVLNPVAGSNDPNDSYISIMRENLDNLKVALECKQ